MNPLLLLLSLQANCTSLLPPTDADIVWVSGGEVVARDALVEASRVGRVYRRTAEGRQQVSRTVGCENRSDGLGRVVSEVIGAEVLEIPFDLPQGEQRALGPNVVRRLPPPGDGSGEDRWFSVSASGGLDVRLVALRTGVGIREIRSAVVGGREILTAVVVPAPQIVSVLSDTVDTLRARLQTLERQVADQRAQLADAAEARSIMASVIADSMGAVRAAERQRLGAATLQGARLVADSALRLRSEDAAERAHWPGSGHRALGQGGVGWTALSVLALGAIGSSYLPERARESESWPEPVQLRAGGAALLLLSYLGARAGVTNLIREKRARGETREAFLERALVTVTAGGQVQLSLRQAVR